jgi:hypothetical protein
MPHVGPVLRGQSPAQACHRYLEGCGAALIATLQKSNSWSRERGKVLERIVTTESTTLVFKRQHGGKTRVTSLLWEAPEVILKGEVLEIRNFDCRLQVARKERHPDELDPPVPVYPQRVND